MDPKVKDVGFKHARYWSRERLLKELKKCILLCANCHREVHDKLHQHVAESGTASALGAEDRRFESFHADYETYHNI